MLPVPLPNLGREFFMQTKNIFLQNIFKTDCSKRDFLSDQIGGLFKTANDAFSSEHFVNFCEKGSKKCVLAAYHMRDFFGGTQTGSAGAEM